MYPDDRVLVAVMNNLQDWEIAQSQNWYRIPAKNAPAAVPHIDWLAFYFTAKFNSDRWAIHYYAPVIGHELVTRKDLFPHQPKHPRAGKWYYKLILGDFIHKLPPIVSQKWKRITFIFTTGDRFEHATTIGGLFADAAPNGLPFVTLKETPAQYDLNWATNKIQQD